MPELQYQFTTDDALDDDEDEWLGDDTEDDAPAFLGPFRSLPNSGSRTRNSQWTQPIPDGERNATLTALAGALRAEGDSGSVINVLLQDLNQRLCQPPLAEDEVAKIAASIGARPVRYRPDEVVAREGYGIALLDHRQLKDVPKPDYLIAGLIVERAITVLYGPAGSYKSFLALNMAASVATGEAFAGRAISAKGSTLYLAAEGMEYLGERLTAWESVYGVNAEGVYVTKNPFDAVLLRKGLVGRIVDTASVIPRVRLVVIDTYAKSALGVNEDRATEVSQFLNAAQRIRDKTGAAVLILHHEKKAGGFRGSSALMANVDAMIRVKPDTNTPRLVTLESEKNRGYEAFQPFHLRGDLVPVPTESHPENTSLVFVEADPVDFPRNRTIGSPSPSESKALLLLQTLGGENGLRNGEWKAEFLSRTDLKESAFNKAVKALREAGLVTLEGGRYVVTSQGVQV